MLTDEGFASFFRQEYPRVVLYLRKNGASEAEAEEAVQEAMAQAYRAWDQIIFHRAWVRKAAFTCFVHQAERARRENPMPELRVLMAARVGPSEGDRQEEQWRVIAIMRQLPSEQRKVAALFYDGLSLEEIATAVGKPVATVRSLLRHARTRLKKIVQSEGADSPGVSW